MELLGYLWPSQKNLKYRFVLSLFLNAGAILSVVLTPVLFRYVIDSFKEGAFNQFQYRIFFLLFGYVIFWSLGKIFVCLREITMLPIMEEAICNLSYKLYQRIQTLSFEKHLAKKTGELGGVIETAITSFPAIIWAIIFSLLPFCVEIILTLAIISYFCGVFYSIFLFLIFFLIILVTHLSFVKAVFFLRKSNLFHLKVVTKMVDGFLNFSSVKYFNKYEDEFQKIKIALEKRKRSEVSALIKMESIHLYQIIILSIGFLVLTILSYSRIITHQSTIGNFIMINAYILHFSGSIEGLAQLFRIINHSFVKMEKAINFLKTPNLVKKGGAKLKKGDHLHIVFENVWFGHKGKPSLLRGVSFEVLPHETIAIIGETGSGKSTILGLLLRFLEPTSGNILINGYNLSDIDQESLLDITGITPQNVTLFNETILSNLLYASPTATKKEIEKAILFAALDETIKNLSLGLDTHVGEQGAQLSGGERQRIGIARTLLRSPGLYIFDEGTSSLDKITEEKILQNINTLKGTKIFITHSLHPLLSCNKVLRLKKGKIYDAGVKDFIS